MNAVLNHKWGESLAADRVWSQVSGLRPSLLASRCLLVFQAFVDESEGASGYFVLAGVLASAQQWAAFSVEWENMLRHGTVSRRGDYHFKMNEMALEPERRERVSWFFNVAAKHSLCFISSALRVQDVVDAQRRISSPDYEFDWGALASPYFLSLQNLVDKTSQRESGFLARYLPADAVVDFYFDERTEKKLVREHWDNYMAGFPAEKRALYGHEPRFEHDHVFLPLQAADLFAWHLRRHYEDGQHEMSEGEHLMELWKGPMKNVQHWMHFPLKFQALLVHFAKAARHFLPEGAVILDRDTGAPIDFNSDSSVARRFIDD